MYNNDNTTTSRSGSPTSVSIVPEHFLSTCLFSFFQHVFSSVVHFHIFSFFYNFHFCLCFLLMFHFSFEGKNLTCFAVFMFCDMKPNNSVVTKMRTTRHHTTPLDSTSNHDNCITVKSCMAWAISVCWLLMWKEHRTDVMNLCSLSCKCDLTPIDHVSCSVADGFSSVVGGSRNSSGSGVRVVPAAGSNRVCDKDVNAQITFFCSMFLLEACSDKT